MKVKVGIIHTTPATISSLEKLAERILPEAERVHILDDSILKDMIAGKSTEDVKKRWMTYAEILKEQGADAVLSACSTVGEIAEEADRSLGIPVYRIDEAMAVQAVERGSRISVLATLPSTLGPTARLIGQKAKEAGKSVEMESILVDGAYALLMQGNCRAHDERIREAVEQCSRHSDVIVLAQASMAAAVSPEQADMVLTSPVSGMEKLKRDLTKLHR